MKFAVVDVETTGVYNSDRIVEIAIVGLDEKGDSICEFESLVNPMRDVGPTEIHGLEASDLIDAPLFEDIVGDVLELLGDAVFVAHNATFDTRFVKLELERAGAPPPSDFPRICTMHSAKCLAPSSGRSLDGLCTHFGIPRVDPHSALCDARATAEILVKYLSVARSPSELWSRGSFASCIWPLVVPSRRRLTRRCLKLPNRKKKPNLLRQLVSKLPLSPMRTAEAEDYLFLLDRVLEDRIVTEDESAMLLQLAQEMDLTHADVEAAHRQYLNDLLAVARQDGVVSPFEAQDLKRVQQLLGITDDEFAKIAAAENTIQPILARNLQGKSVCFTGQLKGQIDGRPISRKLAEELATDAGMQVEKRVKKELDFLVVRDPNTLSGKAKAAREYGVRIVAESAFWKMLNVQVH